MVRGRMRHWERDVDIVRGLACGKKENSEGEQTQPQNDH